MSNHSLHLTRQRPATLTPAAQCRNPGQTPHGVLSPSQAAPGTHTGSVSRQGIRSSGAASESALGGVRQSVALPQGIRTLTEAFQYLERCQENELLVEAMAKMIRGTLPAPDHFVTLTLRDAIRDGQRIPLGWIALDRAWRMFCRHVRHCIGHRFEFVYVVEPQAREVPHIHALTWNTAEISTVELCRRVQEYCWRSFGMTQFAKYNPTLSAGEYLAKYLFKGGAGRRLSVSRGLCRLQSGTGAAELRPGIAAQVAPAAAVRDRTI